MFHRLFSFHNSPISKTLLVMALVIACHGCGQSATRVSIPIKVQSEIDVSRYSSFAVLPFLEVELEDKNAEPSIEMGNEISSMMRRGLGRHKNLNVIGTQETMRMLTGETIGPDLLKNIDRLVQLGQYFEVDAVVTGSYKFYTISRPRRYYGERYSSSLQRYVTDYQDYLQKTYILSLHVSIVDVDAEEFVWEEDYERSAVEAHTFGSFLVSQVMPHDSLTKNLAKQAVKEFTRKAAPHYETEERFLVK